ncbi:hypothetical protein STTU_1610 [Streptomyces sp. Tu6071]|nr:hypothetical protein STTU_1610 [Streptomyces sp. Tu6071]
MRRRFGDTSRRTARRAGSCVARSGGVRHSHRTVASSHHRLVAPPHRPVAAAPSYRCRPVRRRPSAVVVALARHHPGPRRARRIPTRRRAVGAG